MTDMPADWAIKDALGAAGLDDDPLNISAVKVKSECRTATSRSILAHARLIELTFPAPVDRKLLVAREAIAHVLELEGSPLAAMKAREADADDQVVQVCLKFHELWNSGYAA